MPDLFHYFFTGVKVNELTDASTSQMLDPYTKKWAYELVEAMGLPTKILGNIVPPGTVLGPLRSSIASETGINPAAVVLPASHDTASAVAAVPASGTSWAYLSSGDVVALGSRNRPAGHRRTRASLQLYKRGWRRRDGPASEEHHGSVAGSGMPAGMATRRQGFQLRRTGPADRSITPVVGGHRSGRARVPASREHAGGNRRLLRRTGQTAPREPGAVVRCALEGLAFRYRWVLERLEELTGQRLEVIHVVGGGSQNDLLCQFTADACNRPVLAGPVEATAIGNLLVQAIGRGLLGSLQDAARSRPAILRGSHVFATEPQRLGKAL